MDEETPWGPLCGCSAAPSRHRHHRDSAAIFIEPDWAPGHEGLDRCDYCGWTRPVDPDNES